MKNYSDSVNEARILTNVTDVAVKSGSIGGGLGRLDVLALNVAHEVRLHVRRRGRGGRLLPACGRGRHHLLARRPKRCHN